MVEELLEFLGSEGRGLVRPAKRGSSGAREADFVGEVDKQLLEPFESPRVSPRLENTAKTTRKRIPLTSKISNPAISSTPMNVFVAGLPRAVLILSTIAPNIFS